MQSCCLPDKFWCIFGANITATINITSVAMVLFMHLFKCGKFVGRKMML